MGCCFSSSTARSIPSTPPEGVRNQVIRDWKPIWKTEEPMTYDDLIKKRNEFWDTAPAFEGQKEIWQALRAACEAEELALAQAIIDSAEVSLPNGTLEEAYDELGNKYVVPLYCISDPKNIIFTNNSQTNNNGAPIPLKDGPMINVKLRLSSGKDLKLQVSENESIRGLKGRVFEEEKLGIEVQKYFLMGKPLSDEKTLKQIGVSDGGLVQVLIQA